MSRSSQATLCSPGVMTKQWGHNAGADESMWSCHWVTQLIYKISQLIHSDICRIFFLYSSVHLSTFNFFFFFRSLTCYLRPVNLSCSGRKSRIYGYKYTPWEASSSRRQKLARSFFFFFSPVQSLRCQGVLSRNNYLDIIYLCCPDDEDCSRVIRCFFPCSCVSVGPPSAQLS